MHVINSTNYFFSAVHVSVLVGDCVVKHEILSEFVFIKHRVWETDIEQVNKYTHTCTHTQIVLGIRRKMCVLTENNFVSALDWFLREGIFV